MDGDWQDIETAPTDGREVWVRRVYDGKLVSEGWAVFGICDPMAPQSQSLGPDPLGRLSAADYIEEDKQRREYADEPKWLKPSRMYSFPTPTHWLPEKVAQ